MVDIGGQGGGEVCVHAFHNVVGDQHGGSVSAALKPGGEGEKVPVHKVLVGALVQGDAGVGVGVVTVAGKVLQHAAHAVSGHLAGDSGDIVRRGLGVLAKGAVENKIAGAGGDVRHRRQVHVEAQSAQQHILLPGVRQDAFHAAQGVQSLGRSKFFTAKVRIGADTHYGAALLVHADQQGDSGRVLIALDGLDEFVGGFVFCIPAKEDIAAQMVGIDVLNGVFRRTADEEQLAHLFLQGHGGQQFLQGVGFRGRGSGLLNGRSFRFGFLCRGSVAAGCEGE